MGTVSALWRHPIKAHGRESVGHVSLVEGQTFPGDRRWAVAHEAAKTDGGEWASCGNFSRGAKAPELMAITSRWEDDAATLTLSHPALPDLAFKPDADPTELIDWVRPIMPKDRAASTKLVPAGEFGMTDSPFPSIAIHTTASHRAIEGRLGRKLATERWRGNIWLEGFAPWEEFEIGRAHV